MSRQKMLPGTRGEINIRSMTPCTEGTHTSSCKNTGSDTSACKTYSAFRARVRVALPNGVIKEVESYASTATLARQRVKDKADGITGGKAYARGSAHPIMPFVEQYIERSEGNGDIKPRTAALYRTVAINRIKHHAKGFDAATLDIPAAITLLKNVRDADDDGKVRAKHFGEYTMASHLLRGAFQIVLEHGLQRYNVIEQSLPSVKLPKTWAKNQRERSSRALSLDEVRQLQNYFEKRPRSTYMGDLITVLVGTGLRISEVLALQHGDLKRNIDGYNLHISRHLVEGDSALSAESGLKAYDDTFVIEDISPAVVAALQSRQILDEVSAPTELVFAARGRGERAGKRVFIWAPNVRTALRVAAENMGWSREADGQFHISPHSFRKTYLNWIETRADDEGYAASKAAGHTSTGTTKRYYLDVKGKVAPSVRKYGDIHDDINAVAAN